MDQTSVGAARMLARALIPLTRALGGTDESVVEHVEKLGWTLPAVPQVLTDLRGATGRMAGALAALEEALRRLPAGSNAEDALGEPAAELLLAVAAVAVSVDALPDGLRGQLPPDFVAATRIDEDVRRRLYDDALSRHLESESNQLFLVARVLGLVESVPHDADPARHQPAHVRRVIRWDRLRTVLDGPGALMRDVYGWGTSELDSARLFQGLRDVSFLLLSPASFDHPPRPLLRALLPGLPDTALRTRGLVAPMFDGTPLQLLLGLYALPAPDPQGFPGLVTVVTGLASIQESIPITPAVLLTITSRIDLAAGVALAIWPDRPVELLGDLDTTPGQVIRSGSAEVGLTYSATGDDERLPLFGFGPLTLDFRRLSLTARLDVAQDGPLDVVVESALTRLRVQLRGLAQDSFLSSVVPDDLAVEFDLVVGWSRSKGFYWRGSAEPEIAVPVARKIGPVELKQLVISLASPDDTFRISMGVSASTSLGPLRITVEGVGATIVADTRGGNLGLLDVTPTVRPPTGIGVAIDAGPVRGGGFLAYDAARGEYAGALELQLGRIGLKAVGLLSTGPADWSLLLLLYAQIPPVQLGFGFTLEGIGGLVGVRRGVDLPQLISGMRTGALDDILFPPDPVGDAPRILSRLRTIFPARAGSLTVGPMVDIHWGDPVILTARLAILLQLDNALGAAGPVSLAKIMLLGTLRVAVGPTREDPYARVVELNVDVLGFWDLADRRYGFLALLRDSTVAGIDLTGGLGVWGEYGDHPRFLLAAGGFNPRFRDIPPQLDGVLDRLGASFSVGRFKLTLAGYFALTPATIQAGLNLRAVAKIGPVGLVGDIGFDVLVHRRPRTHFIADFHVIAEVTYRGHTLAGVKVKGTIEGPGRWHIVGSATFSILWWDISASFNESWGSAAPLVTELFDVATLLGAELAKRENWSAQLPVGSGPMVTLVPRRGDLAPRAHPLGRFVFSQQIVPLGLTLEKFGDGAVAGPNRFDLQTVTIGGRPVAPDPVREHFARAQFVEMAEEDRLTRPSFEEMDAGVAVSSGAFEVSAGAVRSSMSYETAYLNLATGESHGEPRTGVRTAALDDDLVHRFGRYGAAGRAPQRAAERMSVVRVPVDVSAPLVAVADRQTLRAVTVAGPPTSVELIVEQRMRRAGVTHGQVVDAFEVVMA